jgi:hypothetical protein
MDRIDRLQIQVDALTRHLSDMATHTRGMQRHLRWWRGVACGVLLVSLMSLPLPTGMATEEHTDKDQKGLAQRVRRLEAQVKALQATLAAVTFDATTKELVITRANLRIVNGLGRTDCGTEEEPIPACPNGLGNLIVGYNEPRQFGETIRTGSHNVVVGSQHNFSRFGGVVVGLFNTISGDFASVSGGNGNTASGNFASVSGGSLNTASSFYTSVSGGETNTASGLAASVSGGGFNTASGGGASVSGGSLNTASSGNFASVSGGNSNTASGGAASVSGGQSSTASGGFASVSGGQFSTASGDFASVSGGSNRSAPEANNWAAGSLLEPN